MRSQTLRLALGAIVLVVACGASTSQALGTAFTYQGYLEDGGTPINGICDLRFDLYTAPSGGSLLGQQTKPSITITAGVFTIPDLDFGANPFDGSDRWLEIRVRCPASVGGYSAPFTPRQQLTAVPYALFAASSTVDSGDIDFSSGNIEMANSTSSLNGNILKGGARFMHNYGTANAFLGANAGNFSLTGVGNTAVGSSALSATTVGNSNTAVGESALAASQDGDANVAIGQAALVSNVDGDHNTAVGTNALDNVTSGLLNIAVGKDAGTGLTTGQRNIYLGSPAGAANETKTMRLGQAGAITTTYMAGIRASTVDGGGVVGALPVLIDAFGKLGTSASTARVKCEVHDMGDSTERLMRLRPVRFFYKNDVTEEPQYGLIAEEVEEVIPELVVYDTEGRPEGVRYHLLSSMLLNEMQKQNVRFEHQARLIAELTARLAALEAGAARCGDN